MSTWLLKELNNLKEINIENNKFPLLFNEVYIEWGKEREKESNKNGYQDFDLDIEKGYLMQDLYYFLEDIDLYLQNEIEKEDENKRIKNDIEKIIPKMIDYFNKYICKIDSKNTNEQIKELIDYVWDYYYLRSELNSWATPWCDCWCGGDSMDWKRLYKEIWKEEDNINKLSFYYFIIK